MPLPARITRLDTRGDQKQNAHTRRLGKVKLFSTSRLQPMHISTLPRGTRLVRTLCLGAWLACVGCGERRADVTGKAIVDGKPLNSKLITILFAPDLDNPLKKIPSGVLDDQGTYTMSTGATEGVPLGRYRVHVHWDSKNAKGQPCPV